MKPTFNHAKAHFCVQDSIPAATHVYQQLLCVCRYSLFSPKQVFACAFLVPAYENDICKYLLYILITFTSTPEEGVTTAATGSTLANTLVEI